EGEIVFRLDYWNWQELRRKAGKIQFEVARLAHIENYLTQGRVIEIALRAKLLDELFKRQILMIVSSQRRFPYTLKHFSKRRIAGKPAAHHQRVDKKTRSIPRSRSASDSQSGNPPKYLPGLYSGK